MDKTSFQQLLFLFTRYQQQPAFDFVALNSGWFSFQAQEDIRVMLIDKVIEETAYGWRKTSDQVYAALLKPKDRQVLLYLENRFGKLDDNQRISFIQNNYMFRSRNEINDAVLFTIGYEGLSLEKYITKLQENNVRVLCDVRKNAFSMKFGFSKHILKDACEKSGIVYVHIPDLGIDSEKRRLVNSVNDHNNLFAEYEKITLEENISAIQRVIDLIQTHKRIALTCFEASHCDCHRGVLANYITQLPGWKYELQHL